MNITGMTGLTVAQIAALKALGAIEKGEVVQGATSAPEPR
jgi:hypothetical protein